MDSLFSCMSLALLMYFLKDLPTTILGAFCYQICQNIHQLNINT